MQFHFPSINEQFHRLYGMRYFTKIDLLKGFYQVEIEETDKRKTAFSTMFCKYEFNRLPFGMLNAPKFFHNINLNILSEIENVIVLVDNNLLFSRTEEEHISLISEVLTKFKENNIIINLKKSLFNQREIPYLGFIINQEGYRPDLNRISNFNMWPKPKTRKQLQRLLGTINWYRPFLKKLSIKLHHLYEKLKASKRSIELTEQDMLPVKEIHRKLKEGILLYFPNLNEKFIVNTDASEKGFGAILYQSKGIVGILSKKFNEAQIKYTTIEREMYAIYYSVKYWNNLIKGSKILVHTDNRNIISDTFDFNKRTERWKAFLCEYDLDYVFIKGETNQVADNLSRNVANSEKMSEQNEINFQNFNKSFHLENGHPGCKTIVNTLRKKIEIKNSDIDMIKRITKGCIRCQLCKPDYVKYGIPNGRIASEFPFKDISTDIFGPIPAKLYKTDIKGKLFVITFTDRATRFTKIKFLRNITPRSVIDAFRNVWIRRFVFPRLCYPTMVEAIKMYLSRRN